MQYVEKTPQNINVNETASERFGRRLYVAWSTSILCGGNQKVDFSSVHIATGPSFAPPDPICV